MAHSHEVRTMTGHSKCVCKPARDTPKPRDPRAQAIEILRRLYYCRNPDNWKDAEDEIWADAAENVLVQVLAPHMPLFEAEIFHEKERIKRLEAMKHHYSPLSDAERERANVIFQAFKNGDRLSQEDYVLLQRAGKL